MRKLLWLLILSLPLSTVSTGCITMMVVKAIKEHIDNNESSGQKAPEPPATQPADQELNAG